MAMPQSSVAFAMRAAHNSAVYGANWSTGQERKKGPWSASCHPEGLSCGVGVQRGAGVRPHGTLAHTLVLKHLVRPHADVARGGHLGGRGLA